MGQVGPRNILFKHRSMNIGNEDREWRQKTRRRVRQGRVWELGERQGKGKLDTKGKG